MDQHYSEFKSENNSSAKKHVSTAYISTAPVPPPPPPMPEDKRFRTSTNAQECSCNVKKCPPPPRVGCLEVPKLEVSTFCPPPPKTSCFNKIKHPVFTCGPIQTPCIPVCPPPIGNHELPAGSCSMCDTFERESNTVSLNTGGKTVVLCSEGFEKRAKYVTRKDNNGMTHSYCKETETKSNMAKGTGQKYCKPPAKPDSCKPKGKCTENGSDNDD